MKNKELQVQIHDRGYSLGYKKFKLFTFSRIFGAYSIEPVKGLITFNSPIKLTVSSVNDSFLSSFLQEVMTSEGVYLNGTKLYLISFEPIKPIIKYTELQIEMLSPLTVYKTQQNGGNKYTNYLTPWDEGFVDLIKSNLLSKFRALYSDKDLGDQRVNLIPLFDKDLKFQKIIRFKSTIIKSWLGTYRFSAPIKLLEHAYFSGIGVKNSEGFGCFRIFGSGESL